MFVITADQRNSRRGPDRVPDALGELNHRGRLRLVRDFIRTAGDEIQGLSDDPQTIIDASSLLLREGHWSVGIGVAAVETPLPMHANAGRGPGFLMARTAIDEAKHHHPPIRLIGSGSPGPTEDSDVLLRLLATIWQRRTPEGWQALAAMADEDDRTNPAQAAAAARLGISRQALGQRLRAAAYQPEKDALPLMRRLLSEANETIAPWT